MGRKERLVERRGDGPLRTADMAMTQMMYAAESKEPQTEKEARRPKRQPKRQPKKQASRQAGGQADGQADRQATSVGRGWNRARSKGQMQPCERNRWLVESASPGFPLRRSPHRRCGLSLSQPLAGEEGQSRWVDGRSRRVGLQ